MSKNYTSIYFPDTRLHMTWNFGTPLKYPLNVKPQENAKVIVVGKYNDKDVSCLIVTYNGITHQPCGTLLHITTRFDNGVKPVESGRRATKNGYKKIEHYELNGFWS